MDKLKMSTPDLSEENIKKIANIFPSVITEKEDENGDIIKGVDFDLLRQVLSKEIVEGGEERYRLDWPGKKASILKANTPITDKTLRPVKEDSVDFENTENLYIEGDNFQVLKLLQESYLNKVKMIYIDPPYNTGKDFVYRDNFTQDKDEYNEEVMAVDEEGNKLFKNTGTNGRFHSDWLSMMYERLVVARDLLREDGVIFISIGDDEFVNLKKIIDEVFGENNFIDNFIIRSNPRGNQAKKYTASEHEYLLVYTKDKNIFSPLGFVKKQVEYKKVDDYGKSYREIGLRKRGAGSRREDAPNQFFPIYYNPVNGNISTKNEKDFVEILPRLSDGSDGRWRWSIKSVEEKKNLLLIRHVSRNNIKEYDVFEKDYYDGDKISKIKSIFYEKEVNYENATEETKELFKNVKVFDYPKPVYLIKKIISSLSLKTEEIIILDFFSGSATTAHAAMQLNADDGGSRKYIMVQLPEETDEKSEAYKAGYKNICEIGKERIRRAAKKIQEDNKDKDLSNVDFGFRVFRLDSANMKDVYYNPKELSQDLLSTLESNVKEDRSPEDLLTQVLLDLGLELSYKIESKDVLGNKVFFVEDNALVACFDDSINFSIIDEIAKVKPLKVVFKDAGFKDDKDRINVEERFKRLSPETGIKVI